MPLPPIPLAAYLRHRADQWGRSQQPHLDRLKETASAWDLEAQQAIHGITGGVGDTFSGLGTSVQQALPDLPPPPSPLPTPPQLELPQPVADLGASIGGAFSGLGTGLQSGVQGAREQAQSTVQDWASDAQAAVDSIGSGLGALAQPETYGRAAAIAPLPPGLEGIRPGLQAATQTAAQAVDTLVTDPASVAAATRAVNRLTPTGMIGSLAGQIQEGTTPRQLGQEVVQGLPALGALGTLAPTPGAIAGNVMSSVAQQGALGLGLPEGVAGGVGFLADVLTPDPGTAARVASRAPGVLSGLDELAASAPRFGAGTLSGGLSPLDTAGAALDDAVLGIRAGQRGLRAPRLSPEQAAQRAADGAAEQRIFDAIQRLWRQGPEGEALADDLRFLAVGKGEEGEAAARSLLTRKGLGEFLPPGVIPDATATGDGLLGAATRATDPFLARGALTGGERAFDIGAGTAGGVLGAATAEEDATWQERAGRGVLGASLGALAGANARQLGRLGVGALDDVGEDVLGAVPRSARGNAADSAADRINLRARRMDAAARAQAVLSGADQPTPVARPGLGTLGPAERDALRRATAAGREAPPEVQRQLDAAARVLAQPKPDAVTDLAGANGWEKALAFMTSNLLSNPRSLLGNAMGGLEQAGGRLVEYTLEGRPLDFWTELKAAWAAKGDALAGALHQGLTGERPAAVSAALGEATDAAAQHPEAFPGKAGLLATPALRVAGATDALFAMGARAGAEAVADARGLTGARRAAFIKGQTAQSVISQPSTGLAKTISEGRQLLTAPDSSLPDRLHGAAMFASIPVVQIPKAIWEQGVKRAISPVAGLPTAAVQAATGDTAAAGKTLKNWAVNSTVGGVIAWQVGDGNITGSGPQDPNERRRWEAQGWRPTSVRIGGNWYSYDWLGPLGLQMNLTATFAETLAAEQRVPTKSELTRYTAAVGRVGATAIDEHYLANFFKMAHAIAQGDLPEVAAKNVEELGARLVPYAGALNWAARGADEVVREPQGPLEEVQARIPGLRAGIPARIDPTTGQPQRAGGTALERLGGFGRITPETTPLAREVARLQQARQDVSIRAFGPKEKYRDVEQSREQRRLLSELSGAETAAAARVLETAAYRQADDAGKARLLRQALSTAATVTDVRAGDRVARSPKGQAELALLSLPQYEGISSKLSPEEIRLENVRTSEAKQRLTDARKKYPQNPDKGEQEFLHEDREAYRRSQRTRVDAETLSQRKKVLERQYGVDLA